LAVSLPAANNSGNFKTFFAILEYRRGLSLKVKKVSAAQKSETVVFLLFSFAFFESLFSN
jgi:hypothetical protein